MKNNKLKWVITLVSLFLSIATLVAVCVGLGNLNETTESVSRSDYKIGTITETGKFADSKQHAYMEDAETIDGLVIDIDEENATITYKVAFYNEDGEFISMTESMETDFDTANIPESATSFRVEITPNAVDGEPVELNIFNLNNYTSQIEITYNK